MARAGRGATDGCDLFNACVAEALKEYALANHACCAKDENFHRSSSYARFVIADLDPIVDLRD